MEDFKQTLGRISPTISLPPQTIGSTTEYDRQRAAWANEVPGDLKGYDCPECRNRGYSMFADPGGGISARRCRCMALRAARTAMQRCGIASATLDVCTWENWEKPTRWQERAEEMGREYVRRCLEEPGFSGWFVAAGRPGCGKTRLCSTILREILLGGKSGLYLSWRDFARQAKGVANDGSRFAELVGPVKAAPVLYIDDLMKNHTTAADMGLIFEVLNERYSAGRPTIISSELTIDAVLRGDEAIGSRMYERSTDFYLDLSRAQNYRLKNKESEETP